VATIAAVHLCEPIIADDDSWRSRRIFGEHRLVYRVSGKGREQRLELAQCQASLLKRHA
jgi:Txe/YoeB family toxin of Txe-Axe toxin-antitoxin module